MTEPSYANAILHLEALAHYQGPTKTESLRSAIRLMKREPLVQEVIRLDAEIHRRIKKPDLGPIAELESKLHHAVRKLAEWTP